MRSTMKVTGMHCPGCENKIQKVLPRIESVENVQADREADTVLFDSDGEEATMQAVKEKIHDLGYTVEE